MLLDTMNEYLNKKEKALQMIDNQMRYCYLQLSDLATPHNQDFLEDCIILLSNMDDQLRDFNLVKYVQEDTCPVLQSVRAQGCVLLIDTMLEALDNSYAKLTHKRKFEKGDLVMYVGDNPRFKNARFFIDTYKIVPELLFEDGTKDHVVPCYVTPFTSVFDPSREVHLPEYDLKKIEPEYAYDAVEEPESKIKSVVEAIKELPASFFEDLFSRVHVGGDSFVVRHCGLVLPEVKEEKIGLNVDSLNYGVSITPSHKAALAFNVA